MASESLRWVAIPIGLPPEGGSETFAVGDLELLLCNAEGRAYVIRDECPHVKSSLKGGEIRGTILECPLHGGQIDLRDASAVALPIRRLGVCYSVRAAGEGWQVALPD